MLKISDDAKDIFIKRPFLWEYRFYAQVIIDDIEFNKEKILLIQSERNSDPSLNIFNYPSWVIAKAEKLQESFLEFKELTDANHDDAFGPPGVPGDFKAIISFAHKISSFHFDLIMSLHTVKRAMIDQRCNEIVNEFTNMLNPTISFLENYGINLLNQINNSKESAEEVIYLDGYFEIGFKLDDENRFYGAITKFCKQLEKIDTIDENNCNDSGFIYLLINASMAGLVKLGKTTRNPRERAKELGAVTGVPFPFEVIFEAYVDNCSQAEKYVHQRLDHARIRTNKEFFKINPTEAIRVMIEAEKIYKNQ